MNLSTRTLAAVLASALALAACASPTAPPPATSAPSATAPPVESRAVGFTTADGVALAGRTYGSGPTAVILSNMGDNDPAPWDAFAPLLAARGYLVLTYSFRYPLRTNAFTSAMATGTVPDLRAAVEYARSAGARRVVLVGASLGGMTVGKVAGPVGAAAVIVISAGPDLSAYGLVVSATDLAALTMPKLFVASEQDTNTPFADTRTYFEHAPEPKRLQSFAGGAHGVRIFDSAHGDELRALLLGYITATITA